MDLFEVIKAFEDIDGEIKAIGRIIEVSNNRVDKLVSGGYIVPIPRIIAESLLKLINGKLGSDTDFWNGHRSILGYNNSAYKHIHNPSYVYPNDCTLVDAVTSATENTFGDFAELIPANGITESFDIHWANIASISANGTYVVEMHEVSNDDLQESIRYLGSFSISRLDNFSRSFSKYTQIPVVEENKRIGVRAKKRGAGAGTISFNVEYHDYE